MRNLILFLFAITSTTSAFKLTCHYDTYNEWWAINGCYFCDLKYDLHIKKSNAVTDVIGNQLTGKSNADVIGFRAYNKTLHFFPQGLDKFFDGKKIEFIAIWSTGLKEIHQNDLSLFTEMRILSLWDNDIEVIERNLVQFNPKIEYIGLGKNKIKFVDGIVFGRLNNLHTLHIDGNTCISRQAANDRDEVEDLLREVWVKCMPKNDN